MSTTFDTGPSAATVSTVAPGSPSVPLDDAYRYCADLARSHYENFNVGGWITPRDKLPHVHAIYAWCRMVDDLGDEVRPEHAGEPSATDGGPDYATTQHRLERLDWWQSELESTYTGRPSHPITVAIQNTVRVFDIPREPFLRLIQANRIDQGSGRFATLDDVLDYCAYSANPVGHLFLYLFGYSDSERQRLADCTCTALQLTNFWQDVARDYRDRGRIYLPTADRDRFGVTEDSIASEKADNAFRALLRYECDVAMELFRQGTPLVASLDGPARLPVALFTRGGVAVLEAIRGQDYDVLSNRPALSKGRKAWLLGSAWLLNRFGLGYGLPTV
ncbi:MAG: squalene synthase HpnC [Chloroflexi bacterium]|nr:squalene synthase HpnC [Chloroflexota bacterium]MYD47593.1 squalene synthase HpnC [Chloroflexota bacterium]